MQQSDYDCLLCWKDVFEQPNTQNYWPAAGEHRFQRLAQPLAAAVCNSHVDILMCHCSSMHAFRVQTKTGSTLIIPFDERRVPLDNDYAFQQRAD